MPVSMVKVDETKKQILCVRPYKRSLVWFVAVRIMGLSDVR